MRQRYEGRTVLELDKFAVARGAIVALVGPNGSGKSTLLRIAALLEAPTEGTVWLDERPASRTAATRRRVTLVEQRPVLFRGTVRQNLAFGLHARGKAHAEIGATIQQVAQRFGIGDLLGRSRRELSEGEIQRVAVARAFALEPDLLLLDEPVSSADRAAALQLYQALQEERQRRQGGLTVCLASHQLEDAYRWSDDLRALADGRVVPVTPENLFRVVLPAGAPDVTRHVRVGTIDLAVATDRVGPAILAVPPSDIILSREPVTSSARNVFTGRITRLAHPRPGLVQVTVDVGVELVAAVTEEAVRELGLVPGAQVTCAFKASAVRVF
ncbi:MAG: ATP-binding cassette domain-containing protein [Gemmatimonadota bacterium]